MTVQALHAFPCCRAARAQGTWRGDPPGLTPGLPPRPRRLFDLEPGLLPLFQYNCRQFSSPEDCLSSPEFLDHIRKVRGGGAPSWGRTGEGEPRMGEFLPHPAPASGCAPSPAPSCQRRLSLSLCAEPGRVGAPGRPAAPSSACCPCPRPLAPSGTMPL